MARDDAALSLKRKRDGEPHPNLQAKRQKLIEGRRNLPIWKQQDGIRKALRQHQVLILSGETGSGKSTQVPQFLLQEAWNTGKIAVTQPRRVAAITLAHRVADEVGTPCGSSSPASKVGYSVRFDDSTSPSTRIKFVTEGILLQEMLRDATLGEYSCVIVDEVHERSVNVDLLLGFLKQLLMGRTKRQKPLKVVVMSATADVDSIFRFFTTTDGPANGLDPAENHLPNGNGEDVSKHSQTNIKVAISHVEGRQYPVNMHYLSKPTNDLIDTGLQRIFQIHCKEPMPGDILVFLTGQESIQTLQKLAEEFAESLGREVPKLLVLPLFAALPQAAQQRIFLPAPANTRKVILSTNIAETSVTVPGVRFVVDTGKAKIRQFRSRLGLESLLVKTISKSSADQRKGRAGREAPGQCYRLYTEDGYKSLEKDNTPEILRCELSQALLNMKARGVDDVLNFPLLTPPRRETMEKALLQLLQLGALDENGKISKTGRQMARLPLTPSLGRVIIEAARAETSCLLEVIDIVACLSVENIFLNTDTEEAREEAQIARSQLYRREGDHLTLMTAVRAYAEADDRRRWSDKHLISHRAMQSVMDVRKQLRAQCQAAKLTDGDKTPSASASAEEVAENILKCFLRGFWNNVARLCPDGSYKTFVGNQTVAIHPSSFLYGRKTEAIMYNEFVYTNKTYARGVSAVQVRWLDDILG
ncbi:P-loop containing nucleoside triphosphate hydrolase protein [Neohortaea acidophila]|uniref:RNA helicase n=1 Tax=Neohortaea acidophila TaxID=245834 RepID=A0A6A6PR48_9PEZI|nr:P-loop containing nucleoside triphosphate hydrolase protein [Neohortaea acidophila]KAF2481923.1 P-loop containing nucleoside triphosphate hydrolase protein [Neohortaea acidophila]